MIDYQKFIEKSFDIVSKEGQTVPFHLNPIQDKLLSELSGRDIILKSRQVGISSLVLAIFLTDFLLVENSRSVIISHEASATTKLLDRAKFFLTSLQNKGVEISLAYNSRSELINSNKNSTLYIATAGTKALLRGETINNLHFSEPAFYGSEAESICLGAMQTVPQSAGRIIFESTGNGLGNFFHREWMRTTNGESNFKTHFFSWHDFYSKEFMEEKRKEFADEALFFQEYPATPSEAFISTGRPFFNLQSLEWYKTLVKEPLRQGYLLEGKPPVIDDNSKGYWKFWQFPIDGESYLIPADIGEKSDYSSAGIFKQSTNELIATLHGHIDSGELAQNLALAGDWYNQALICPEKNGLGMGVLTALKGIGYQRIYTRKSFDKVTQVESEEQGWLTTTATRPLMLADLQTSIKEQSIKIYDRSVLDELSTFYRDDKTGKPQAQPGCNDDRVIMMAILAHVRQEIPTYGNAYETENKKLYGNDYQYINEGLVKKWRLP